MSKNIMNKVKKGDTLIEVAIAIVIFCMVALSSLTLMNQDLNTIQGTLELEMVRNEMDAQSEALRFIHNSYLSERELVKSERVYQDLWIKLSRYSGINDTAGTGLSNNPARVSAYPASNCKDYYDSTKHNNLSVANDIHSIYDDNAFILNTRWVNPANVNSTIIKSSSSSSVFAETSLYPRVLYTKNTAYVSTTDNSDEMQEDEIYDKVARAEGIWIIATRDATDYNSLQETTDLSGTVPEFYDFHIRSCWYAPGRTNPTTISTIIRLYNPEYIEDTRK